MMGMHNISLRYEMVSDKDAIATGSKTHTAITLGDKIKLEENLSLFAEYFMQTAKEEIFLDADGKSTKNLSAMTLGLVATF
jgi:predicted porin